MLKIRMTLLMLFCFGLGAILLSRAAFIQIFPNVRLEQMAKRQFQSKVLIKPRRGTILDRNGEPLAINLEAKSLAVNPQKIENKRTISRLLSKALDIPSSKIYQKLHEKKEFIWIKRHLSENEMIRLKRWHIIDEDEDLPTGMWLVKESKRVYPHNELASHVLGDVNIDTEGTEGVELWMNEKMRGKVISVAAIKDALGRPAFIDASAAKDAQEGKDGEPVTLTLDASLQFSVEEELRNSIRKTGAKAGTVIVMNAVSGEILALANQPTFDPNEKNVSADRRRNRALTDGYEPGSTMKPILLASALTRGMKLNDLIWGERGNFYVQGKKISEAEAHEQFEWLNLKKIIQVSSNVGAAKLALKVGAENYFNFLKNYKFGIKTGTEFPGEIAGKIPLRKNWTPLTLANIGFGQGLLVTPLQMIRAYATFINGGWLVQPTLVKDWSPNTPKEPTKRVLSQKAADQVIEAMETVTQEGGTGIKAALPGYRVAGKTGTAQKVDPTIGTYSKTKYIASFVGFPTHIDQKFVIFTELDEPHGVYYASETAAPLFREVLNAVINRFSIPPTEEIPKPKAEPSLKASQLAHSNVSKSDVITDTVSLHQAKPDLIKPFSAKAELSWYGRNPNGKMIWKMPSLNGLTPREAVQLLQGHPFQLQIHGTGIVRTQSPEEGKLITDGESVRLNLAEP